MLFANRGGADAKKRAQFERLAEQHFGSIYGTALRLTRSAEEAEDLAQEAIVRAYTAFDRFDGTNFKAWMLRIVTNLYINRYRQRQRGPLVANFEDDSVMEPAGEQTLEPDYLVFENLMGHEVEEALAKLPDEFRMTLLLSDVEGMSYQEIAEATDVPLGTVRSRLARARAMMRKNLEEFALEEGFIKSGLDEK